MPQDLLLEIEQIEAAGLALLAIGSTVEPKHKKVVGNCDQLARNLRINSTHVYEMGYCTFHLILTQFILYSVKYFTSQDWLNLQVSLVLQTNMKTLELHPLWVLNIPTVGFETWVKPISKKIPPVTPLRAGGLLWEDVWATSHCFSVMEAN